MARKKYGFVDATTLNIGKGGLGANMRGSSIGGRSTNWNPMTTVSHPKFRGAGMGPGGAGVAPALAAGATAAVKGGIDAGRQRQATQARERGAAMQQHPAQRSQAAVASKTGGSPSGAVRERPGVTQPPPAEHYYTPPVAMGANVPVSRQKKFAQGAGL